MEKFREKMPASERRIARLLGSLDAECRKHGGEAAVFVWDNFDENVTYVVPNPSRFNDKEQAIIVDELMGAWFEAGRKIGELRQREIV
jgi:hypothetical protein